MVPPKKVDKKLLRNGPNSALALPVTSATEIFVDVDADAHMSKNRGYRRFAMSKGEMQKMFDSRSNSPLKMV